MSGFSRDSATIPLAAAHECTETGDGELSEIPIAGELESNGVTPEVSKGSAFSDKLSGIGSQIKDMLGIGGGIKGAGAGVSSGSGGTGASASSGGVVAGIGSAVKGAASAATGHVAGVMSVVSNGVASFLNISPKVANKVISVGMAGLLVTGGAGVGSLMSAQNLETIWSGEPDCAYAWEEAQKSYGYGEREIPATVGSLEVNRKSGGFGSPYAVMMGRAGGTNSNLGTADRRAVMNEIGYANGMSKSMHISSAADYPSGQDSPYGSFDPFYFHDEDGFCKLDDYYILGVQPAAFGPTEDEDAHIGDWITFYFEGGSSFDAILVDTKGDSHGPGYDFHHGTPLDTVVSLPDPQGQGRPNDICAWGHVYDGVVSVFEFWSSTIRVTAGDGYTKHDGKELPKGDPIELLAKNLGEDDGAEVVSFTNHGTAPECADALGGAAGAASTAKSKARKNGADNAGGDCAKCKEKAKSGIDNSSIASTALSIAYSQSKTHAEGYDGTKAWLELWAKMMPNDGYPRSCDSTVCTIMRASGADPDYQTHAVSGQKQYCLDNSDLYERIDWVHGDSTDELQPGDIFMFVNSSNPMDAHTSMYVGNEAVEAWEFKDDADVGEPQSGAFSVSGSLSDRAPGVGSDDGRTNTNTSETFVFRFKGEVDPAKASEALNSIATPSSGASCDDKQDDDVVNDELAKWALAEYEAGKKDGTYHRGGAAYVGHCGYGAGTPWCSCFVKTGWDACGFDKKLGTPTGFAMANSWITWVKHDSSKGELIKNDSKYDPKPGDIIVQGQPDGVSTHVGIVVEELKDGKFHVIEGNYSNSVASTYYEPGAVWDWVFRPDYD